MMSESKSVNYKRATATKVLSELITRVRVINTANTEYLKVSNLYVFGSYLKGTPTVHDLDIALDFEYTPYYYKQYRKFLRASGIADIATAQKIESNRLAFNVYLTEEVFGHYSVSYLNKLVGLESEYYKRLKNRSRVLSFHPVKELGYLELDADDVVCLVSDGKIQTAKLNKLLAS